METLVESKDDQLIIDGLRLAESIRNLSERTALKICLALAGTDPITFIKIFNLIRTQNLVPPSTLELKPVTAKGRIHNLVGS